ncbi:MAG: MucR family transcriptional regulator [Geodermatophilaceae bacterium]
MLHPVGRLPPQVYWRRRMLLIGVVMMVVLAAGWFVIDGLSGGQAGASVDASIDPAAVTSTQQPVGVPAVPGLEQVLPSLAPANPVAVGVPAASASPAPPVESLPPPAEPGPCPDEAISLGVGSELGQYQSGSKPLLGLSVTNISALACIRDLDLGLQTYGLFAADGTRLWGSNDCFPEPSRPTLALLQPGQVVAFSIIWSGRTSEPTCTAPRPVLGPGSYILRGYLANLVSADAALVLT